MQPFHWSCPYCNHDATITNAIYSEFFDTWNDGNKDGHVGLLTKVVVCPNPDCNEYEITATLHEVAYNGSKWVPDGPARLSWALRPQSSAKVFPSYIPAPILQDYAEACAIRDLSPKASATLSRRCLQGIIRDYWGVTKSRLVDEIAAIQTKVDPLTWQAIDAVRGVGNIGAHMERDINLVIEVDPGEANMLIGLLEVLLADWYVTRHEREQQLKGIVALGAAKAAAKKGTATGSS